MADKIRESGMDFIAENTFRIEKSSQYMGILSHSQGVRTVDFVRVRNGVLMLVEATETFNEPKTPTGTPLSERVEKIKNKFIHSLCLYSCIALGVNPEPFPATFQPDEQMKLAFVLVITFIEKKSCRPIKSAITKAIPLHIKSIWNPAISVMNHETAKEHGLANIAPWATPS